MHVAFGRVRRRIALLRTEFAFNLKMNSPLAPLEVRNGSTKNKKGTTSFKFRLR